MVPWPSLAIFFRVGFDPVLPIRTGAQTTGFNATLCDCVDGWRRSDRRGLPVDSRKTLRSRAADWATTATFGGALRNGIRAAEALL